jgi:hypothetical protein
MTAIEVGGNAATADRLSTTRLYIVRAQLSHIVIPSQDVVGRLIPSCSTRLIPGQVSYALHSTTKIVANPIRLYHFMTGDVTKIASSESKGCSS